MYHRKKLKIERLHQNDNVAGQADMDIESEGMIIDYCEWNAILYY